jgi:hypothetical protein
MTKRKFEIKVKKEIEGIISEEIANFNLNIINIEPVIDCDNDGEALVQLNLQKGNMVKTSTATLLYSKKVSKKEDNLNTSIFLDNKSVYKLIKDFKGSLSSEVVKNKEYPEVVDNTIVKLLLAIYKKRKKEYVL